MDVIAWDSELAALAARHGERVAVVDGTGATSYRALIERAAGLADRLVAAGVEPGTPVATLTPNGAAAAWAGLGVALAGAADVTLNPAQGAAERDWCLGLAGVRHLVAPRALIGAAPAGAQRHPLEEVAPAPLGAVGAAGRWPRPPAEAWGRVLFTSGTTGRPKGVVYSHGRRWLANVLLRLALPERPGARDRVLLMTPFSHGASLMTYAFLGDGASVHLMDGVQTEVVCGLIERGEINQIFAPPTPLAKLVAGFEGRRFEGIRTIYTGTATLSPALYRAARAIFGPVVRVTYGMSEIFNPITVLDPVDTDRLYGTEGVGTAVGWPGAGVEVSIRDEAGQEVAPGAEGEIHLRTRHMFVGYLLSGGFTPLPPEGFHATGDIGRIDPGSGLHLLGRRHDVIKTGGYKVFPQEIEAALAERGAPPELAVFGLPSDYWGQIVVGACAAAPGWEERARQAAAGLTRYKQPRFWVAVPELPRNAIGKIDRNRLRSLVLERHRLVDGPHPALDPALEPGP